MCTRLTPSSKELPKCPHDIGAPRRVSKNLNSLDVLVLKYCGSNKGAISKFPAVNTASLVTTDVAQGYRYETTQQWKNMDKLCLQRSQALIDSLPNELLCEILKMAIEGTPYLHCVRKYALMNVCRHWRNVILNTPRFWNFIPLAWPASVVKEHIKWSRQCSLDATICDLWHTPLYKIHALLDVLIPTAHRWNSLIIENQNFRGSHISIILNRLGPTVFPVLTYLCIDEASIWHFHSPQLRFLSTHKFPMLKELKLFNIAATGLQIPSTLERLTLCLTSAFGIDTWLPSLSRLKALSLAGCTKGFSINPNSIHLPSLARFACHVTHAEPLLQALLAPNLTHVDYSQSHSESLFHVFNEIKSKLKSVRELRLWFPTHDNAPSDSDGLISLCLAAPEVRGVEVMDRALNALLGDRSPIDHWKRLERVAIIGSVKELRTMQRIVPWLKQRRNTGKRRLEIGFSLRRDSGVNSRKAFFRKIRKFGDGVDFRVEERIAPLMPGYTPCTVSDDSLNII